MKIADYFTACRCGKMIQISFNTGESKELTCDNCGTRINFKSENEQAIVVHFLPQTSA